MPGFLTAVGAGRPCAFSVCRLPVQARPRSRHSRRLGDTVEVCAVQLPGRESRMQERCIGSVEALVAALEFSMRELMDCPYAILGYSMGQASPWNYVAGFAAASCLSPSHCLSSARPALACRRGPDRGPPHEQFVEELRRLGGTSQAILENSELLDIFLPVLRADFALSESYDYRVQEPLSLPTFAYAGESDAPRPQCLSSAGPTKSMALSGCAASPAATFRPEQPRSRR